jgi:ankyrin repeat protein
VVKYYGFLWKDSFMKSSKIAVFAIFFSFLGGFCWGMGDTQLIDKLNKAIKSGDSRELDNCLGQISYSMEKINQPGSDGLYPIHAAVMRHYSILVKKLIEDFKANVNVTNRYGDTPLDIVDKNLSDVSLSVMTRHLDSEIKNKLDGIGAKTARNLQKTKPSTTTSSTQPPQQQYVQRPTQSIEEETRKIDELNKAIIQRKENVIYGLVYFRGPGCIENFKLPGSNGVYPLIQAVKGDNLKLIKFLVEHGAELGVRSLHGLTPLDVAIEWDLVAIQKYLESKNADLNLYERKSTTTSSTQPTQQQYVRKPIQPEKSTTTSSTQLPQQQYVQPSTQLEPEPSSPIGINSSIDKLNNAIMKGDKKLIHDLVLGYGGADINLPGSDGSYPIHKAVEKNDLKTVESLVLFRKANLDVKDANNKTPRELAVPGSDVANVLEFKKPSKTFSTQSTQPIVSSPEAAARRERNFMSDLVFKIQNATDPEHCEEILSFLKSYENYGLTLEALKAYRFGRYNILEEICAAHNLSFIPAVKYLVEIGIKQISKSKFSSEFWEKFSIFEDKLRDAGVEFVK